MFIIMKMVTATVSTVAKMEAEQWKRSQEISENARAKEKTV
jgi:hypothetical protein